MITLFSYLNGEKEHEIISRASSLAAERNCYLVAPLFDCILVKSDSEQGMASTRASLIEVAAQIKLELGVKMEVKNDIDIPVEFPPKPDGTTDSPPSSPKRRRIQGKRSPEARDSFHALVKTNVEKELPLPDVGKGNHMCLEKALLFLLPDQARSFQRWRAF